MTAFEDTADKIDDELKGLDFRSRAMISVAWAEAARPDLEAWCHRNHGAEALTLFDHGLSAVSHFVADGTVAPDAPTIEELMDSVPEAPAGGPDLTAAQDAFASVSMGLDAMRGEDTEDSIGWYMLEPHFQAQTERDFGATELESQLSGEEAVMLGHQPLATVVNAIEEVLRLARENPGSPEILTLARKRFPCLSLL